MLNTTDLALPTNLHRKGLNKTHLSTQLKDQRRESRRKKQNLSKKRPMPHEPVPLIYEKKAYATSN
jgi:hypothetical protein